MESELAVAVGSYFFFWRLLSEMAVWRDAICTQQVGVDMRCMSAAATVLISQTAYITAATLSAQNIAASALLWLKDERCASHSTAIDGYNVMGNCVMGNDICYATYRWC